MKYNISILSSKGGRKSNQDKVNFECLKEICCFTIADGLGGHNAGEIASNLAVKTVLSEFRANKGSTNSHITSYISKAQHVILSEQKKAKEYKNMRTTLVLLIIENNKANWAHIGDSRLYIFRNNKIIFRTKDHSVTQALVNAGQIEENEIRFHEDRNKLLRVLGSDEENFNFEFYDKEFSIKSADKFLLCTDGFWEYITEEQMENDLINSKKPKKWLKKMEKRLKNMKLKDNDNYSAIAIFIK